jgi:hypothetical protein
VGHLPLIGVSARCSLDGRGKLSQALLCGRGLLLADRAQGPNGLQAGLEPGPGNVSPCPAIEAQCAYHGGGGKGKHSMGLGNGGPDAGSDLAEQLVCLRGKFLSATEMLRSGHGCSIRLAVRYRSDNHAGSSANSPTPHAVLVLSRML